MARVPHIAYVCADRGVPIGARKGASTHVAELTRALAQRGARVHVLAARTSCLDGGPPVTDLGSERTTRLMRQLVFTDAAGARQQARAAEAYGLLLNHALARELDRLHRRWRIDAVYERYSLWSYAGAAFARSAGVPYLLEVNAPLRDEQRRYRTLENAAAAASLESYLMRVADRVIVPSTELRSYVIARGVRPGAVCVMPNAADPALFSRAVRTRLRHEHEPREFVVGFVGSLKPWHGLDHLVRAFQRLYRRSSDYRLLIVGDGPLRASLERTLRRLGLHKAVVFAGEVDHDQVPALLARMNVAVAPYPRLADFYFSPLKLFEYMAAGVPVVASDIGQIGELLRHRRNALLHPPGAAIEMAACIEELRRKPILADRLARAARALVRGRFSWRHNADRVLAMMSRSQTRRRQGRPRSAAASKPGR